MNENLGIDSRTANTILLGKLSVGESLRQIFVDGLFLDIHKFTLLCKPISGRDIKQPKFERAATLAAIPMLPSGICY